MTLLPSLHGTGRTENLRAELPEDWQQLDSYRSWEACIEEIGRRVREGEEGVPTTGYFGRMEPT